MTLGSAIFSVLLGLSWLLVCVPEARAESFGFYTGSFRFDSNTISGNAEGMCDSPAAANSAAQSGRLEVGWSAMNTLRATRLDQ